MASTTDSVVYLGIGGHAVAVDLSTGQEIWRRKVKGGQLTTVVVAADRLLVTAGGEIWCLDRESGAELWHNRLKGLGVGLVTVAGANMTPALAAALIAQQQAAAAGAAVATSS